MVVLPAPEGPEIIINSPFLLSYIHPYTYLDACFYKKLGGGFVQVFCNNINLSDLKKLYIKFLFLKADIEQYKRTPTEENKNKFLPKDDDINPNKKFIDNLFFKFFLSDKSLISKLEKYNLFWNDNDHDIIRKIFKDIVKHDLYFEYLNFLKKTI